MESSAASERGWRPGKGLIAFIVIVAVLALLVLAWRAWDLSAERQLQAEIDAARARGEKILLEDFTDPPAIPDDQNAAFFWKRAGAAAEIDERHNLSEYDLPFLGRLPASPAEQAWLREVVANREPVWNDVRAAMQRDSVNWNRPAVDYITTQNVAELTAARRLARLLRYHATVAQVDGDDATAVEDVRAILRLGRDVEQLPPSLVTHLVATGINAIGVATIEQIAPDLKARPDAIRKLRDSLLDHAGADRGWIDAMRAERASMMNLIGPMTAKPILGTTQKVALARALKWQPILEKAGMQPDYPSARAFLASNPPPPRNVYRYVPSMPGILQAALERGIENKFRIACDRRMAATALAIVLYRAEHAGTLPSSLQDLVPTYLASLPPDPFAAGGKSFGYSGPAATQPFIYSVGVDGADDGGSRLPIAVDRGHGMVRPPEDADRPFDRWQRDDALFYLVHLPRPAPATQSSD